MFATSSVPVALSAALLLTESSAAPSPDSYQLVNSYSGNTFFSGWSFWDQPDPTNGFVNYTNLQTAKAAGLAGYVKYEQGDQSYNVAHMGVDFTTMNPTAGRASVRISSDQTWSNGGLFVADVRHTPAGVCGMWPALWLVGPDWPNNGEIDIIEGVNDNEYNSATLHTGPGCKSSAPPTSFLGKQVTTDCDVSSGSNTGCSIRSNNSQSVNPRTKQMVTHPTAGHAFNRAGGGVYVTHWNQEGIKIWLFARNSLPADITAGKPDPSSWTAKPIASFGGNGCDYSKAFSQQQLVINMAFCGDWAGKAEVWDASPVCKAKAPTCQEFVANNPAAFKDSYWHIASIQVFQTKEQQAASGTSPIAGGNGNDSSSSPSGTSLPGPSASATTSAMVYSNSTNFTALRSHMAQHRRFAHRD